MVSLRKVGTELKISWGKLSSSYGSGEPGLVDIGLLSGLLFGVAVGVKLLGPHGVETHDGVTALMPEKQKSVFLCCR